jgi:hypothetical protein
MFSKRELSVKGLVTRRRRHIFSFPSDFPLFSRSSSPASGRDTLVAGDRERFTALAATREEMVRMLEAALHPASPEERQKQKDKIEEIS